MASSENRRKISATLARFYRLLEVDKQEILSIYVYAIFNGLIALSLPLGIQAIINLISAGQVSTSWIVLVTVVIAGVALTGVIQIMQLAITENLQQKIFTRSAFEFAYRLPRLRLENLENIYAPEMVNRFFDTLSVQKGLSKILIDFSSALLQVFFGLILLSFYHPFFIVFSMIQVVIGYFLIRYTAPNGLITSLKESKRKYEVVHWLEEIARSMDTFKLAGNSELPVEKTDKFVAKYLVSRKAHFRSLLVQYVGLVGFKVIIATGLLVIGGLLVINQQMNIGQFVASEIIIILVLASVEKLLLSMETIYDVLTSVEKIGTVTDLPLEPSGDHKLDANNGPGMCIHLKQLTLNLNNQAEVQLDHIDLNIEKGDKICISGSSGSGKSVLLQVLAGLYDGFNGALNYNSVPFNSINRDSLRSLIGDSLASEDIFDGTLFNNLTVGKPQIDVVELSRAAEIVGLTDFIEGLHDGYQTQLFSEGKNLAKNIRVKIMLARCLIGNPKLILLDDTFNQLESKEQERLITHLLKSDQTVVVVSNQANIAAQFDKTLLIHEGKIVSEANWSNTLKSPWFNKIYS